MPYPSQGQGGGSRPDCRLDTSKQNAAGSVAGALRCKLMMCSLECVLASASAGHLRAQGRCTTPSAAITTPLEQGRSSLQADLTELLFAGWS